MSDIVNIKNLDELDAEYVLICKDADDIFNDLKFNNKKEEDTCRMIIDFIEKTISKESKISNVWLCLLLAIFVIILLIRQ